MKKWIYSLIYWFKFLCLYVNVYSYKLQLCEKLLDPMEFKRYILTYVSYDEVETIYE